MTYRIFAAVALVSALAASNYREEHHLLGRSDYDRLKYLAAEVERTKAATEAAEAAQEAAEAALSEAAASITASYHPYSQCSGGSYSYRSVRIDGPEVIIKEGTEENCGEAIQISSSGVLTGSYNFVFDGPSTSARVISDGPDAPYFHPLVEGDLPDPKYWDGKQWVAIPLSKKPKQ